MKTERAFQVSPKQPMDFEPQRRHADTYLMINLRFYFPEASEVRKASITLAPRQSFMVSRRWSSSNDVILEIKAWMISYRTNNTKMISTICYKHVQILTNCSMYHTFTFYATVCKWHQFVKACCNIQLHRAVNMLLMRN